MNTGNEFCKIKEHMREVTESFGLSVPTIGLQKKVHVIATEAFKSEDNIIVCNIQRHMCHSAATCEKFYQHRLESMNLPSTQKMPSNNSLWQDFLQQLNLTQ